jgi:hypothetical protein
MTPTPTATPPAIALITPEAPTEGTGSGWANALGIGAMVAGLGLTVLAGVAVMLLWRKG